MNIGGLNGEVLLFPGRQKKEVQLFRSKRKWWLYYGGEHMTGHFNSKKEAMRWFNNLRLYQGETLKTD